MDAAIFERAGQPWVVQKRPDPAPGPGEMVIRVGRCGVCGTDLNMTSGKGYDFPSGSVLGHEYCGEVVALGQGVEGFKTGDIVSAMPAAGCGSCEFCVGGFPLLCNQMRGMMGGFAEYTVCAASSSIKLPSTLTLADGALVEPLAVGLHGVALASPEPGARILVLGAGAVGLAAIFWARRMGATRIVAASRSARRADLATALGATAFVQTGEGEGERIIEVLGGPPDTVYECVGVPGLLGQAITHVSRNGTVVSLGFCAAPDPVVPAFASFKQARLLFSLGYTLAEFQHVADTLTAGHLEPRQMITDTIPLAALPAAIEALRAGAAQTKIQVAPAHV